MHELFGAEGPNWVVSKLSDKSREKDVRSKKPFLINFNLSQGRQHKQLIVLGLGKIEHTFFTS